MIWGRISQRIEFLCLLWFKITLASLMQNMNQFLGWRETPKCTNVLFFRSNFFEAFLSWFMSKIYVFSSFLTVPVHWFYFCTANKFQNLSGSSSFVVVVLETSSFTSLFGMSSFCFVFYLLWCRRRFLVGLNTLFYLLLSAWNISPLLL